MPTFRLLPPLTVGQQNSVANGRTYSAVPGQVVDAPDTDAGILAANGWVKVAFSGPTSARLPTRSLDGRLYGIAAPGTQFFDSDLGYVVVFDGVSWRNPSNGDEV